MPGSGGKQRKTESHVHSYLSHALNYWWQSDSFNSHPYMGVQFWLIFDICFLRMETVKPWKQSSHTTVKIPFLTGLLFFQTLMRLYLHLCISLFYQRQGEFNFNWILFVFPSCKSQPSLFRCLVSRQMTQMFWNGKLSLGEMLTGWRRQSAKRL